MEKPGDIKGSRYKRKMIKRLKLLWKLAPKHLTK